MLCLKHYDKLSHESDDTPCYVCDLDAARSRIAELEAERDRLRVECEAWRSGRLYRGGSLFNPKGPKVIFFWTRPDDYALSKRHDTIDDVVDALMAEMEVPR
jgi:hypothetical protein